MTKYVYASDLITHQLETLNREHKQAVGDITDRIVELEKALAPLQITADNTHIDVDKEQKGSNYCMQLDRENEAENILADIVGQFSNKNKNSLQE